MLLFRKLLHYKVKAHQHFIPHILILHLETGRNHGFIICRYISLGNASKTNHIAAALGHFPDGVDPILVGDLDVNIYQL